MREILFRGKLVHNGEWVQGDLLQFHDRAIIHYYVNGVRCADEVDINSVGQYTGLLDYFGNRIFEGDIVEGPCHSAWRHDTQRCVVAYGRYGFECRHHIDGLDSDYYKYKVLFSRKVEVIGNIHDNPELLKGE